VKHIYLLSVLFFLFFHPSTAKAQQNGVNNTGLRSVSPGDTLKKKKSSLKLGVSFNSNSVFLARTDSVATPVFNTGITYTLKSGIFLQEQLTTCPAGNLIN
jgi:hypothetical protein